MTPLDALRSLSDDDLHAQVQRLTARSNVALAELLAHLGEVEARGVHRARACASLYTYCIYELRMSEDAAYRRSKAARLLRQYPELGDAIAKGELHLTGALLIGPHLGGERHAEILRRARFRSKREVLRLVAEIDPRPEVPARITPIGPEPAGPATHRVFMEALAGPVRELPRGQRPEDWMDPCEAGTGSDAQADTRSEGPDAPADARPPWDPHAGPSWEPLARPLRYHVTFTASQELVDLLDEVTDLLGHERPRPSLPDISLRALSTLARELRAQKRAATDRPRQARPAQHIASPAPARVSAPDPPPAPTSPRPAQPRLSSGTFARTAGRSASRHIPAAERRVVWQRDGARCAYVDERGVRCRETGALELHHVQPHALGGPATAGNLELRCRAHNILAAEQDFGRNSIAFRRGAAGRDGPPVR